jgi:hypothetical protein
MEHSYLVVSVYYEETELEMRKNGKTLLRTVKNIVWK